MAKIQISEIRWASPKLREGFYKLEKTDSVLFKQITSALDDIERHIN